ncbi:MAG TPA: GAF domain-containing protein [Desulfobacteraceae bacterium]|nr:GAF domain-containing protein [Desulfobacteraceae bacterium]
MISIPQREDASGPGRSIEEQLEYHKRLNHITNRIHSAVDTSDILLNLQHEILSFFSADRITVYVVDGIRKQIVSRFKTGNEVEEIRVPISRESIAGFCATTGNVLNIADVYDAEELSLINPSMKFDSSWDKRTGFRTRQLLVTPITYEKYLLGVLQLINRKGGGAFNADEEAAARDIAKVLGTAFFKNQKTLKRKKGSKFDYLVSNGIISVKDLEEAVKRARTMKRTPESVLMSDFKVSREDIGKSLSAFFKTRFIPYDEGMVPPGRVLKNLKAGYLKSNVFVPVGQEGDRVVVAMENPAYLPARDAIKRIIAGKEFEYCVSLREDIFSMIDLFFDQRRSDVLSGSGSIEDILGRLKVQGREFDEEIETMNEEDSVIVQLVNKMIVDAYGRNASDIHIEPRQGKADALIRFRIDGACQVYQTLPHDYKRALVSRLKIMAELDIAERRIPQDGKIKFRKFAPLDIELRVATIPTAGRNEDVVMRILAAGDPIPLEKMGMSDRNYKTFIDIISEPYGIALVVGPTGSGKTTTLHAALGFINKPETKIWTAEDPVEITQEGLRQVQVQPKIGLDFAAAMRSFLRADPDVIMVGEMRDHETVATGIEASLTGHLVLSTLHTNSAPETITRLLDMGMDPFNFGDALLGVLAQRLVRTLCKDCKEPYHPSPGEYDTLARSYGGDFDSLGFTYGSDFTLYRPGGCPGCGNTGYRGRTGIHELLVGTDDMKTVIQTKAGVDEVRRQAVKDGMTTLLQDGIRKVCLGTTNLLQVRKVCIK